MSNDSTFIDLIREQSAPLAPIATKLNPSTKPLKGIRHIAFDVYGTLFTSGVGDIGNSSSQHHGDAISTVLSAEGLTSLPSAPELSKLYRSAIRNSQQESTDNGALRAEVEIREVWKEVLQYLNVDFQNFPASKIAEIALRFELAVNPVWPMPDLVPVLDLLAMQLAPYSIVSNAQFFTPLLFPALTGKSLSELHIQESTCIWSFEQREAKPSTRRSPLRRQRYAQRHLGRQSRRPPHRPFRRRSKIPPTPHRPRRLPKSPARPNPNPTLRPHKTSLSPLSTVETLGRL